MPACYPYVAVTDLLTSSELKKRSGVYSKVLYDAYRWVSRV